MKRKVISLICLVMCISGLWGCSKNSNNHNVENTEKAEIKEVVTNETEQEVSAEIETETSDTETGSAETYDVEGGDSTTGTTESNNAGTSSGDRYINGYKIPDDNSGMYADCGDDIRVVNGIVVDCTNMTQTQIDNIYELCNAGYYTPVYKYNLVNYHGQEYNTVCMLIKKTDSYEKYRDQLVAVIEAEGGCTNGGGGGNFGCGYDMDQGPYIISIDYLTLEQQYCEVSLTGGGVGYLLNTDYLLSEYGVSDDVLWYCIDYPNSPNCDKSLGVWDEANGTVTYSVEDIIKIYQIMISEQAGE